MALGCQDHIASNATFSGLVTFDLDAPDLSPRSENSGLYQSFGPSFGLFFAFGGYTYSTAYVQVGISYAQSSIDQDTFYMKEEGDWFSRIGLYSVFDRARSGDRFVIASGPASTRRTARKLPVTAVG